MARLIDAENYRNLFNEEFKKTMELIRKGETHLDTLAEGFTEADRVIRALPTIDPVHAAGACYCRECRNYNKPRLGWCSHHMDRENPDDFCSWGQRREGSQ
mgnify:FL=1